MPGQRDGQTLAARYPGVGNVFTLGYHKSGVSPPNHRPASLRKLYSEEELARSLSRGAGP